MKYSIQKEGDDFCVYDEEGNEKGKFSSRSAAMKEMKSLYAEPATGGDDSEGMGDDDTSEETDKKSKAKKVEASVFQKMRASKKD